MLKCINKNCLKEEVGPFLSDAIQKVFTLYSLTIIISIIFFAIGILLRKKEGNISFYFFDLPFTDLAPILTSLTSVILSIIFVKFLLAGNTFTKKIKEILEEAIVSKKFLESYTEQELVNLAEQIQTVNEDIHIKYDNDRQYSIQAVKNHYQNLKDNISKKEKEGSALTKEEENFKKINYVVNESSTMTTILKNGLEIIYKEYEIEIMDDGEFTLKYRFQSPFDNLKSKKEDYLDKDRFSDFSYHYAFVDIDAKNGDSTYELKDNWESVQIDGITWNQITFSRSHTHKTSKFKMMFSLSFKEQYTTQSIADMKLNPEKRPTSTYAYPHAVRNIVFQTESYGISNEISSLEPMVLLDNANTIDFTKVDRGLFYKRYEWTLYYSKHIGKEVTFKIS